MVKFTNTTCDKIIEALKKGDTIDGACGYANISRETFYKWYNEGASKKSGKKKKFHDEVDKAKSHATDFYENAIYEATMKGIWQSAAWWLERRRRETYNKPDKILVNPKQDLSEFVEDKEKQDEIFDDL